MATEEQTFSVERILTDALDKLTSPDGTIQADPATAAAEITPGVRTAIFREAIMRVQALRDAEADAQVRWYVGKFTEHDPTGLSYQEALALFEADDWRGWDGSDSEAIEIYEGAEGAIGAFDRALDILTILAHGGVPEQGSEAGQ